MIYYFSFLVYETMIYVFLWLFFSQNGGPVKKRVQPKLVKPPVTSIKTASSKESVSE